MIPIAKSSVSRNSPTSLSNYPIANKESESATTKGVNISAYTNIENHFSTNINLS
jgi:hypothetical protein